MKFDREGVRDSVLTRLVEPVDRCTGEEQSAELTLGGGGSTQDRDGIRQACVIPFRRTGKDLSFCLITSYDNDRWIFPKGFVDGDESLVETGLKEAFEEAGLHGRIEGAPLGRYVYSKWGSVMDACVLLMEVERSGRHLVGRPSSATLDQREGSVDAPRQAGTSGDAQAWNAAAFRRGWLKRPRQRGNVPAA